MMRKVVRRIETVLSVCCLLIFTFIMAGQWTLPSAFNITQNGESRIGAIWSFDRDESKNQLTVEKNASSIVGRSYESEVKFLGIFPVKDATVHVMNRQYIVPSGEPFGIKIYTQGVVVVGSAEVDTEQGMTNPGKNAGIKMGDIIDSINGKTMNTTDDVAKALENSNGGCVKLMITRENEKKEMSLYPAYSKTEKRFKAGLWVRDSTAGVGTLTYYDPDQGVYAGLGHAVCDVDTGEMMPLLKGECVRAKVSGYYKGSAGAPGSLCSNFQDQVLGQLLSNTDKGLYGKLECDYTSRKKLPVAFKTEIKKGRAQILATIDGTTPQLYEIEIEKIILNNDNSQKDMVISVTDERLLQKTGGIVQGMSGTPIIQNGMFVGAVTHVFVNNPKKGYAIFGETMVEHSNTLAPNTIKQAS